MLVPKIRDFSDMVQELEIIIRELDEQARENFIAGLILP